MADLTGFQQRKFLKKALVLCTVLSVHNTIIILNIDYNQWFTLNRALTGAELQ